MEDNRVTQSTIDIVIEMHNRGLTNIGTVFNLGCLEPERIYFTRQNWVVIQTLEFVREFTLNPKILLTRNIMILS